MSDRIVLRKVYAVDSNTGLTMEPGNVLLTNTIGGTTWIPMLSSIFLTGGPIIGNLPCTLSSFSTITYINTTSISTISTTYLAAICSLGAILDNKIPASFADALGQVYVSTATLDARLSTLISDPSTISTMSPSLSTLGFVNLSSLSSFAAVQAMSSISTVMALGTLGYVSTLSLISTVAGLGSAGYISSINTPISFQSTVAGLGTAGYVSIATLFYNIDNLGQIGYISTTNLISSINNLGTTGYVSTANLISSINNLGTTGYISSISLTSTIKGLGQIGYVSTAHLVSTTDSLINLKTNIRYDNVTTLSIIGGNNVNNFTSIGNLIYVSTFFQSSIGYSGATSGTQIKGKVTEINMEFSTAVIKMDSFNDFIDHKSRVTIEVYPTYAFSKLATNANNVAILPISTLLKYGNTLLNKTVTTNYLYAGNTRTQLEENNGLVDSSNIFNQPIRLSIPQGTFVYLDTSGNRVENFTLPYTLYHYMPNSINNVGLENGLHSEYITPYFGPTGSIFVSVQNSI